MLKINVNGVVREMTMDEIEELNRDIPATPAPEQTPEDRIAELEEALAMLLSGVTE